MVVDIKKVKKCHTKFPISNRLAPDCICFNYEVHRSVPIQYTRIYQTQHSGVPYLKF